MGLPVQINSTVTRHNLGDVDALVHRLETLDIVLWSVFFLVPTGRGRADDLMTAEEFEQVFAKLHDLSRRVPFDIKTTEAQHYRRYLAQACATERREGFAAAATSARPISRTPEVAPGRPPRDPTAGALPATPDGIGRAPRGVNDAKGLVFISHSGEVFPSGFLPLSAGNVRRQSLAEIYRDSPLFVALRDPSRLKGKCGVCEFRQICGGSRARAYALTGDPFAEEPRCAYQPWTGRVTPASRGPQIELAQRPHAIGL
jgi:radical SAM protein with 4Fe4S-binding SPASM domain